MSSILQYTELYRDNAELIDKGSAPVLNKLRRQAFETLSETASFPAKHTEGFEKTSIEDLFAPDYGINILRKNLPVNLAATFRCDVPRMSTLTGFVVNDAFIPGHDIERKLPEGVIFCSLAKAAEQYPGLVEKHYGRLAPAGDATVALNNMLVQDGVFIYISLVTDNRNFCRTWLRHRFLRHGGIITAYVTLLQTFCKSAAGFQTACRRHYPCQRQNT